MLVWTKTILPSHLFPLWISSHFFCFYTPLLARIIVAAGVVRPLFMVRKSPRRVNFFGKKWDFYGKKFTDSLIMVQKSAA